jgi:D-serine deaminase-like pyridoxal phosphate-dependent protein
VDNAPTPFLAVDVPAMRANIDRMAEHARRLGVALRPHAKTHKCAQVAARQLAAGAVGLTVATLSEAEVFATHGAPDLFIAYSLWLDDARGERLRSLASTVRLRLGVDSAEGAIRLARQLGGTPHEVLVEVDSGHHRCGVAPADAGPLAAAARTAGLDVAGVFTFPGHSYSPHGRASAADDEHRALAEAAASLSHNGIEPRVVSGGSTPSIDFTAGGLITELRPGVYVFGDAQQWELGATTPERIALTAYATVVSHAGGRAVLDSGSKVLGADHAAFSSGYGRLLDHPQARIVLLSEHHAVVDLAGAPLPPLGSQVRVVPNHVCSAVNLADRLVLVGGPETEWPVHARGANS